MAAAVRAALYLRVSTGRQADNDLSIPDQRRQAKGYCTSRGWEIAVGSSRVPPARASEARRLGNTHAITRCGEPLQLHEPMQIQSSATAGYFAWGCFRYFGWKPKRRGVAARILLEAAHASEAFAVAYSGAPEETRTTR